MGFMGFVWGVVLDKLEKMSLQLGKRKPILVA